MYPILRAVKDKRSKRQMSTTNVKQKERAGSSIYNKGNKGEVGAAEFDNIVRPIFRPEFNSRASEDKKEKITTKRQQ